MRAIKFRAWAEDWNTHKYQMFYDVQCAYDTVSNKGNVMPHDQWTNFSELLDEKGTTVMQFTGLLDRNGKEIYEGDILSYEFKNPKANYIQEMEWEEAITECCQSSANGYVSKNVENARIIGNLYENPELLK